MKKLVVGLMCLMFVVSANGQSIEKEEVDEFTGVKRVFTSWETICMAKGTPMYARIWKSNDEFAMDIKINGVPFLCSIDKGAEIIFLFNEGGKVTLNAHETVLSKKGAGVKSSVNISEVYGLNPLYIIGKPNADFTTFKEQTINKFRVYRSDGYIDYTVNKKQAATIQKMFQLF